MPDPMNPECRFVLEFGLAQVAGERSIFKVPDHVVAGLFLCVKALVANGAFKTTSVFVISQVVPQGAHVVHTPVAQRARVGRLLLLVEVH